MADSKHLRLQAQQNSTTTSIDRISDLPDSILCHILSFLDTLTAVTTSLLSRRWRHLWKYLQLFSFHDPSENPHNYDSVIIDYVDGASETLEGFIDFVNTVLSLRKSPEIHEFRLSCGYWFPLTDSLDYVDTWLRDAIGPHLRLLHFSIEDSPDASIFALPLTLFTSCTGLVTLSLEGAICVEEEQLSTSFVVNFPSLKTLCLRILGGPIDVILSGCPVLETLSLRLTCSRWRMFGSEQFGKIRMPTSLKRLVFSDGLDLEIEDLVIDTPSLEYVRIDLRTKCSNFTFKNWQNVVKAYLDFSPLDDGYTEFMLKLLGALTRTKYITMILPTLSTQLLDFPKFGFLLQLRLAFPYVDLEFMVNLLQNCDMLQELRIQQWVFPEVPFSVESWTQPLSDPNCLKSHLIDFVFHGYQGFAREKAFITYILQRGLVLKTVKIHTRDMPMFELSDAKRHILSIERGSNMCHVNFTPI